MKTLQDFNWYLDPKEYGMKEVREQIKDSLRLEAKKWIEELQTELEKAKDLELFERVNDYEKDKILSIREEHPAQIKWIEHFFNL